MDSQAIISALAFVSWALLGIIFYELRGQLKQNTQAHHELYTQVKLLVQSFDFIEKGLKERIENQEKDIKVLTERMHDVIDNLAALWGYAHHKGGWEIPDTPHFKKRKEEKKLF